MANTSGLNNQSVHRKDEAQSTECPPDNNLQENSQENLDARLDHAIEETFPTSDPISVHITKGPEPERPDHEAQPEQDTTEHVLDQVRNALHDVTEQASGQAHDLYDRGEHYVRQAGEQYPQAKRYIRAGEQAVTQRVTENPLLALFMAGVAGYALAWLIHGKKADRTPDVPDHARTDRGYASHRDRQSA
jgi:ElaB/YqjD/DUF883 family membrane-anchored ribosome-binding protein